MNTHNKIEKKEKNQLNKLTRMELLVFASEANSTNDQELVDEITDEIKRRNKLNL